MLKTASRKAAGKPVPEAYPLGYVEDDGEPRTTREVVFSILLEARSPLENSTFIWNLVFLLPGQESAETVRMPTGYSEDALYGGMQRIFKRGS